MKDVESRDQDSMSFVFVIGRSTPKHAARNMEVVESRDQDSASSVFPHRLEYKITRWREE